MNLSKLILILCCPLIFAACQRQQPSPPPPTQSAPATKIEPAPPPGQTPAAPTTGAQGPIGKEDFTQEADKAQLEKQSGGQHSSTEQGGADGGQKPEERKM
jgi:hypothetical protein